MASGRFLNRESSSGRNTAGILLVLAGLGLFCYTLLITAWLSDDAYITYRVVDNFINGHGLRWNVAERVQAYTHPLWLFFVSIFYALTREDFLTFLVVSMATSFAAVVVLVLGVARNWGGALVALMVLVFSRAFVDYCTSGLENPLTYLLMALFFTLYFRLQWSWRSLFTLSLLAGLATLNRMDSILLFGPAIAYAWASFAANGRARVRVSFSWPLVVAIAVALAGLLALLTLLGAPWLLIPFIVAAVVCVRTARPTLAVLLGFLPFVLWQLFSIAYYGFPFPNTAYAKLGTGIPSDELFEQGLWYLAHSWQRDPSTIFFMFLGIALGFFQRSWRMAMLSLGALLYIAYVLKIGGDFMGGRFFGAPLFVAVALLSRLQLPIRSVRTWALAAASAAISLSQPFAPPCAGPDPEVKTYAYVNSDGKAIFGFKDDHGIGDERRFWYQTSGLLAAAQPAPDWVRNLPLIGAAVANKISALKTLAQGPTEPMPRHKYVDEGNAYRAKGEKGPKEHGSVGFRGFFAGPECYIVDYYALADPLLARLPARFEVNWRIGHFARHRPEGYMQAASGDPARLRDAGLQEYYAHLLEITRGPVISADRWKQVVAMNFGRYDHLVPWDALRFPLIRQLDIGAVGMPKAPGTRWNAAGNIILNRVGVQLNIGRVVHNSAIEFSFDNKDTYLLLYMREGEVVGKTRVTAPPQSKGGLAVMTIPTPLQPVRHGYDAVRVFPVPDPERKEEKFSMGHARLL
jgi:arabinofuranosyltransferase